MTEGCLYFLKIFPWKVYDNVHIYFCLLKSIDFRGLLLILYNKVLTFFRFFNRVKIRIYRKSKSYFQQLFFVLFLRTLTKKYGRSTPVGNGNI